MGRPRSKGPVKDSYCVRLEQLTIDRIDSLRNKYIRISAVSGSGRQFSRSWLIEQAINEYCSWKRTELRYDNEVCGRCGQTKPKPK